MKFYGKPFLKVFPIIMNYLNGCNYKINPASSFFNFCILEFLHQHLQAGFPRLYLAHPETSGQVPELTGTGYCSCAAFWYVPASASRAGDEVRETIYAGHLPFFFFLAEFFSIFFSSLSNFRCNFFTSSAGGRFCQGISSISFAAPLGISIVFLTSGK